jgi:NADPH2:quinone reductase
MKAVMCHRFACVEQTQTTPSDDHDGTKQKQQQRRRPSFQPRKPKPLRLRDCLSLDEVPYPTVPENANETWIVIQTEHAGIQYPDALQARGLYQVKPRLPYIPGMDVVGIVLKVVPPSSYNRPATAKVKPGDRVMATLMDFGGTGGLSEIILAPLKHVFPLPLPMSPLDTTEDFVLAGAAFANVGRNYFAAYHSLVEVGHIDPSSCSKTKSTNASTIVLVTGASGGVGMATIELAKAMGCTVVAGVGSLSKKTGPESVGADVVLCYGRTKLERKAFRREVTRFCKKQRNSRGVDLVVDVVMGDLFEDALVGCLKPLGTIALVGFAAGQRPIRPGILLVKEARVAGSLWGSVAIEASEDGTSNKYDRMVENILGYLSDGSISGRVDRIVPVSRFIEAFEVFEENKGRGNTVISFVEKDDGSRRRSLL